MGKCINKVILIGNLTRNPELRSTGKDWVCEFGIATNRQWIDKSGEKKTETEFHRIIAWGNLAELCDKLLIKGKRVYVEGRLQTRKWTDQNRIEREKTEITIEDMLLLDSKNDNQQSST